MSENVSGRYIKSPVDEMHIKGGGCYEFKLKTGRGM